MLSVNSGPEPSSKYIYQIPNCKQGH